MKKITALLIAIIILSVPVCAFAAKPTEGKMGIGMQIGGTPTIKYFFTKDFAAEGGLGLTSSAGASTMGLMGRGLWTLSSRENVSLYAGGGLNYSSVPAGAVTISTFTFTGIVGIEVPVSILSPSITLSVEIYPLSFSSSGTGGTSTTTFTILSGSNVIISSMHYYI